MENFKKRFIKLAHLDNFSQINCKRFCKAVPKNCLNLAISFGFFLDHRCFLNHASSHGLLTSNVSRHKSKKSKMFGPNVADKYASSVTKNLGLRYNSRPCSAGHFLMIHLSSVILLVIIVSQIKMVYTIFLIISVK